MSGKATHRRLGTAGCLAAGCLALGLLACWPSTAAAQQPEAVTTDVESLIEELNDEPRISIADPTLVQQFVDALNQAREGLAGYRWQERTLVRIDDRELIAQRFEMRLDRQGRLRRTLNGHDYENPEREGSVRRQLLPLKNDEDDPNRPPPSVAPAASDEQAVALKRLAESYYLPQSAHVQRVSLVPAPLISLQPLGLMESNADEAPAETGFRLYDMLQAGDTFRVWMDEAGLQPLRITAETDLAGSPVEVDTEYSRLPDGTVYPARTWVRTVIEEHPVELLIETFGFDKRGRAN
ncbi:hypothetical protein N9971_00280 [bacterium]|nr:hypothetical protein [bacterium]